jgi:formylglycine-generating enzyme required for sulfatase activity
LEPGTYRGRAPQTLRELSPGAYRIRASLSGYQVEEKTIKVNSGRTVMVTFYLDPVARTWAEPFTGMEFVWVPGGCFQMGCGSWADDCDDDEKPVHEVCLDGFWLGKYEVTQGQWKKVTGSNPAHFKKGNDWPVEQVSWKEAQWEYACRSGGRQEKYAGGSWDFLPRRVRCANRDSYSPGGRISYLGFRLFRIP